LFGPMKHPMVNTKSVFISTDIIESGAQKRRANSVYVS